MMRQGTNDMDNALALLVANEKPTHDETIAKLDPNKSVTP